MGFVTQRMIATLTAAVVLMASLNCMCRAAPPSCGDADCHQPPKAAAKPCCDRQKTPGGQTSMPHGDHDDSGDRDHACNHCQSSLVSESASTKNLAHLFDFSFYAPSLAASGINLIADAPLDPHHFLNHLYPPVRPPTLLSLGCALII